MTQITYTALRELTGITTAGNSASFEIGITEYSTSRAGIKDVHVSKGGNREILYHRADVTHSITFEPVNGEKLKQFKEFLASTESGETFSIFLYGNDVEPITVCRDDDTHTLTPFMMIGARGSDYFQASISVIEQ